MNKKEGEPLTEIKTETTAEKTKKKLPIWIPILAVILVIALFVVKGNYAQINDILNPSEPVIVPSAADVQLMMFNPLSNNRSTNAELWLVNIGETAATNISVNVRVRSDNGTVLFEDSVELSSMVLRYNETCTGDYTVAHPVSALKALHLTHTLEISWDTGRHTYSKITQ
jgi:hypothetical protein